MTKTLLDQLKEMTIVVADTGEIDQIKEHQPRDATTNPSLIAAAAKLETYAPLVDDALRWARKEANDGADTDEIVNVALDRLAIEFGIKILELIEGRVSTEVDARLSYDRDATVEKARKLISMYEKQGIERDRILIKIASTWEGIKAAELLEQEGIHCNLTLMFGLHQAIACAEAKVTLISPFVGRILDWYKKDTGRDSYPAAEDPGVLSVKEIYAYYKKFGYATEVMGASFRNLGEITELAGCDLLTISPKFLSELRSTQGELPRKLSADQAKTSDVEKIEMSAEVFAAMHDKDRMANDKLDEGIKGFSEAIVGLEQQLSTRLAELD